MIWGGIYRENWGWLGNQMEGSGKRRKVIGKHICQHCWVKVHVDGKDPKGKEDEMRDMTNSTRKMVNCNIKHISSALTLSTLIFLELSISLNHIIQTYTNNKSPFWSNELWREHRECNLRGFTRKPHYQSVISNSCKCIWNGCLCLMTYPFKCNSTPVSQDYFTLVNWSKMTLTWMATKHIHVFTTLPQGQLGLWGESHHLQEDHRCSWPCIHHVQIHWCMWSALPSPSLALVVTWWMYSCSSLVDLPILIFLPQQ